MDSERFKGIHFLPDSVMGSYDHYIPFTEAYGTSENECPSLRMKTLPQVSNMPVMLEFLFSVMNVTSGVCYSLSISFLSENVHSFKG